MVRKSGERWSLSYAIKEKWDLTAQSVNLLGTPRWIYSIINYIKWNIFMCQTLGEDQQIHLIFYIYSIIY